MACQKLSVLPVPVVDAGASSCTLNSADSNMEQTCTAAPAIKPKNCRTSQVKNFLEVWWTLQYTTGIDMHRLIHIAHTSQPSRIGNGTPRLKRCPCFATFGSRRTTTSTSESLAQPSGSRSNCHLLGWANPEISFAQSDCLIRCLRPYCSLVCFFGVLAVLGSLKIGASHRDRFSMVSKSFNGLQTILWTFLKNWKQK